LRSPFRQLGTDLTRFTGLVPVNAGHVAGRSLTLAAGHVAWKPTSLDVCLVLGRWSSIQVADIRGTWLNVPTTLGSQKTPQNAPLSSSMCARSPDTVGSVLDACRDTLPCGVSITPAANRLPAEGEDLKP
jgi:hypothetical protein